MSANTSALPTIREELDRKSFETLDWLATAFTNGILTNAQYAAGLEALFMTVSGLVEQEVIDLITAASSVAGNAGSVECRHFVKANMLVSVTWVGGRDGFELVVRDAGEAKVSKYKNFDTAKQARDGFLGHTKKLLEMGYTEI